MLGGLVVVAVIGALAGCATSQMTGRSGGAAEPPASTMSDPPARYVGPIATPYRLNTGTIRLDVPEDFTSHRVAERVVRV